MRKTFWTVATLLLCCTPAVPTPGQTDNPNILSVESVEGLPTRIAFGSCGNQSKPQPILDQIVEQEPNLFIYLGDNIYGDTKEMKVLQAKYDQLGDKKEFQKLRSNVPVLSVWDDHDYGWNDAGKEYEFKEESKAIFMDFWKVPEDSPRRQHKGIYGVHTFEQSGRAIQIILLDTRTFRDRLKFNPKPLPEGLKNAYQPDNDETKTLLGEEQWAWLESVLREPADLRIVCSSIQFGHEYNGWESWTNLPREQDRMIKLVADNQANGVIFISGDVHWAEISKREFEGQYPLYDVTASGLTEEWYNVEPNKFRVGEAYRENHFGMIEIDWEAADPSIGFKIIGLDGKSKVTHELKLSEIRFQVNDE
jgi:alkaline phosphatase D